MQVSHTTTPQFGMAVFKLVNKAGQPLAPYQASQAKDQLTTNEAKRTSVKVAQLKKKTTEIPIHYRPPAIDQRAWEVTVRPQAPLKMGTWIVTSEDNDKAKRLNTLRKERGADGSITDEEQAIVAEFTAKEQPYVYESPTT